jgi:hypothetical protein
LWKETWHDMESDLQAARQEIRMLKRSQHDKTLGLETVLTKKEGALEQALHEQEQLQRKCLNASAEVERLTDSLSEALAREENLRKHSEAIGQVFQVRLLELQGKYTAAHESEVQLERELVQVRVQRDQEVTAAAAMFKNVEQRAVKGKEDAVAVQNALDYSARLEKTVAQLHEQVAAFNIQLISSKSRWAFASFRSEHLARRVTELESGNKALASQLRGALDAADRALLGSGTTTIPPAGGHGGGGGGDHQGQLAGKRMELRELELLLSNRNSELLQERERANQLQRQLDREKQLHPAAGATGGGAAILAGGGAAPAGGAIVLGEDGGEVDRGGLAQQLKTFRARALQAEASVREVQAQLEQIQQAGGGKNADEGGLTQEVKEFRARALSAEASMRELQAQSVADKALTENKLISLGNSLVTLKTSLTERDTSVHPSHPSGENDMLRAQLHGAQQELGLLHQQLLQVQWQNTPPPSEPESWAELQVSLAAMRQQVSELQLTNDHLSHQLILTQQRAKAAEDRLARAKEEFEVGRQRLEKEVVALRQVADDRQRRLKERDQVLRLSATGPAAMATSGSTGRGAGVMRSASFAGSAGGGSPSRLRLQPLQDFADGYPVSQPELQRRSRTPLQDYEEARKSGASVKWAHVTQARSTASPRAGIAAGARGSLTGSLLQTGLVESDDSATVTDLDAASMRSALSFTSQMSYDQQRFGAAIDREDDESLCSFQGQLHEEQRSETMSQGSAFTSEILGVDQFLELLRLKNVMPYMVSRQEAETAFFESIRRRGKDHMVFDDFKECIREILASKDMLVQSGKFKINNPDSEDERALEDKYNLQEQQQYMRDSNTRGDSQRSAASKRI